jgi:hypothetical protein
VYSNRDCYIFIQDVQLEIKIRQPSAIDALDLIAEPSAEPSTMRLYQRADAPSLSNSKKSILYSNLKVGILDAVCAACYDTVSINDVEGSR